MGRISLGRSTIFAGRYRIERELGSGGMAIVYLARDEQRGHEVAIKVLRPELTGVLGHDRFLREIRLSQKLNHPQIVPVLDSGEHERQLYLTLSYMEGGTLRARLEKDKQLPLDDVVSITRAIANALDHAHAQGFIHRDVKPENILFTSGQACLADFGIARALERASDDVKTSTSIVRGTPSYMSPEQASGEESLDGRSDVYSLACVVYEMLAGIQPFVGPTQQSIIAQRFTHTPRPVRMYRPGLPGPIEAVLDKGLAVSRADRYQRASDFAAALDAAAHAPDSIGTRPVRLSFVRRHPYRSAVFALAVIATVAVATWLVRIEPPPATVAIPETDPRRIAVLYLDDLTPATVPPHVADGITEDLIDQLGAVRALHVISPTGVRQFKGTSVPIDSIRRTLKVGTIVSGSVARSGNTLRVSARLVDAATGQQLHSLAIEEPWTELFSLQTRLANQVAFSLRQRLGDEIALREDRATTNSVQAWELTQQANADYRRGEEMSFGRDTASERLYLRADSLYARAAQLDEAWAYPWLRRAKVAKSMALIARQSPRPGDAGVFRALPLAERREAWLRLAIELADVALRKSPRSAETLALRGEVRYNLIAFGAPNPDSLGTLAERDLQAAIAIRADLASAWATLSSLLQRQGRFAEAASAAQRAYEADAFFEERRIINTAFVTSLFAEQFADARRWCRMGLDHWASDPRFSECELTLLGWSGRTREDVAAAHRALQAIEARDSLRMLAVTWGYRRYMLAAVLARAGMRDSARAMITVVRKATPDSLRTRGSLGESYVWLLLGERDSSLATLSAMVRAAPASRRTFAMHPWFRPLADDPRYRELLQPAR
jgi:TolB-like protein